MREFQCFNSQFALHGLRALDEHCREHSRESRCKGLARTEKGNPVSWELSAPIAGTTYPKNLLRLFLRNNLKD